jgi:hypothetical protein
MASMSRVLCVQQSSYTSSVVSSHVVIWMPTVWANHNASTCNARGLCKFDQCFRRAGRLFVVYIGKLLTFWVLYKGVMLLLENWRVWFGFGVVDDTVLFVALWGKPCNTAHSGTIQRLCSFVAWHKAGKINWLKRNKCCSVAYTVPA